MYSTFYEFVVRGVHFPESPAQERVEVKGSFGLFSSNTANSASNYLYISSSSSTEGSLNPSTGLGIIVALPLPLGLGLRSGEL